MWYEFIRISTILIYISQFIHTIWYITLFLVIYTNSYKIDALRKKIASLKKTDSPLLPGYLGIRSIMCGTKLRYCLKPKTITYEDHLKNGIIQIHLCAIVNPLKTNKPCCSGIDCFGVQFFPCSGMVWNLATVRGLQKKLTQGIWADFVSFIEFTFFIFLFILHLSD